MPKGWLHEWVDEFGSDRSAIVCEALATALRFEGAKELHEFCVSTDVSAYLVSDDRRSTLWLPANGEIEAGRLRAYPTSEELEGRRHA